MVKKSKTLRCPYGFDKTYYMDNKIFTRIELLKIEAHCPDCLIKIAARMELDEREEEKKDSSNVLSQTKT